MISPVKSLSKAMYSTPYGASTVMEVIFASTRLAAKEIAEYIAMLRTKTIAVILFLILSASFDFSLMVLLRVQVFGMV